MGSYFSKSIEKTDQNQDQNQDHDQENTFEKIEISNVAEDLILNSIKKMKFISEFKNELVYNKIVKKIYTRYMSGFIEIEHEPNSSFLIVSQYNLKYFNFLFPEIVKIIRL